MISNLLKGFIFIIFGILITLNAIWVGTTLVILAIFKVITPLHKLKRCIYLLCEWVSFRWIFNNNALLNLLIYTKWHYTGIDKLDKNKNYLLICNHQTWVDLLALMKPIAKSIAFPKFFIKHTIKWIPFIGFGCWAMEFPEMRRFSREYLAKNPHMKGKDLETTRKFCKKLGEHPFVVGNFLEGTRFTKAKHDKQKSPYKHLLKPKAGGVAYVLEALEDKIDAIANVTITYKGKIPTFIDLMMGRVEAIAIDVEILPIPKDIAKDYYTNENKKQAFQEWINDIWAKKDELIDAQKQKMFINKKVTF